MLKKISSILCVIIGIAVIIMGTSFKGTSANYDASSSRSSYKASTYDLKTAAFGADFYTYIYEGSDKIVDVLNDINKSMETVVSAESNIQEAVATNVEAINGLIGAVNGSVKMIIIAIGLAIVAVGINSAGKAFNDLIPTKAKAPAAAVAAPAPYVAPTPAPVAPAPEAPAPETPTPETPAPEAEAEPEPEAEHEPEAPKAEE